MFNKPASEPEVIAMKHKQADSLIAHESRTSILPNLDEFS